MPTPTTNSKRARSAVEAANNSLNLIQADVLDYLSINRVEDHIATLSTCFAAHVHFITDEDEQCLTIDVAQFTQQVYHVTDLIIFLCSLSKNHRDYTESSELDKRSSKVKGSVAP